MAKIKMTVWGYRCERCGHEWIPRGQFVPKICPSCKSPYWDRPRVNERRPHLFVPLSGSQDENGEYQRCGVGDCELTPGQHRRRAPQEGTR